MVLHRTKLKRQSYLALLISEVLFVLVCIIIQWTVGRWFISVNAIVAAVVANVIVQLIMIRKNGKGHKDTIRENGEENGK